MTQAPKNPAQVALEKKLITVASGKGGVGKTWLSVTLSHALASRGRNVLLFDGDLGLANVDIQLGITPESDLGAVIAGDATLAGVTTRFGGDRDGFDIIPGKSGSGALGNLQRDMLSRLKAGLIGRAADYDHVILDMAAGIDPSVTMLSQHAGMVLVVMTGDPTSLTDAYAFIKVTAAKTPGTDLRIAVNNVPTEREGKQAFEKIRKVCEGFLKISPKLAGIIKRDDKVTDAIRNQVPLLVRHPQSEAARDIEALASSLFADR